MTEKKLANVTELNNAVDVAIIDCTTAVTSLNEKLRKVAGAVVGGTHALKNDTFVMNEFVKRSMKKIKDDSVTKKYVRKFTDFFEEECGISYDKDDKRYVFNSAKQEDGKRAVSTVCITGYVAPGLESARKAEKARLEELRLETPHEELTIKFLLEEKEKHGKAHTRAYDAGNYKTAELEKQLMNDLADLLAYFETHSKVNKAKETN